MDQGSWAGAGSAIASLMFLWAMARQFFPSQLEAYLYRYTNKVMYMLYPYIHITFPEYSGERFMRSEAYSAIESYLSGSSTERAKRLKAEMDRDKTNLVLSMDEHEEVTDEFQGVKVWWHSRKTTARTQTFSIYPAPADHRYYRLIFHQAQRKLINESYLRNIMEQGKAIKVQKRQRKLYTNNSNYDRFEYKKLEWSHVPFEHPATFDTVAMDPEKKQDIVQDLLTFNKSKEYYSRVGKPWKRGYLLYGPPGTGKSTMIAAMANLMDYDVYDLELTAVKDNTALRKLLIVTTSKSIIVIEDIDCSLDLSGNRKDKKGEESEEDKINFYNQAFKVLAKNYLGIEDHALFDEIRELVEKKNITPADVAENLMPKTMDGIANHQIEPCLNNLILALKECKPKIEVKADVEEANGEMETHQNSKEENC